MSSGHNLLRSFTFAFFLTGSLVTSFFPLYFQNMGFSTVQIGLIYSIGPLIGIASNIVWGVVSDKYRTVKKVLVFILFGQLIAAIFIFQAEAFASLILLMAVFFFFQTPVTSLNDSLTLLTVKGTNRSYASFRVWGSIGFAVGAALFGMLLHRIGIENTSWLTLATITCSIVLALLLFDAKDASVSRPDFSALIPIITSKRFLAFLAAVMTVSIAHRMNDNFLALFLQSIGADERLIGWSWMISACSEIPIFFLLSKYGHKFKELPLLAVSCFVYTLRFLLMTFTNEPIWALTIQMMHSISFGIFLFTVIRYIQRVIPDRYRATGQAVFAVTWSGLAGLLSGVLGGWLFNRIGPHAVYAAGSILAAAAMFGFLALNLYAGDGQAGNPGPAKSDG